MSDDGTSCTFTSRNYAVGDVWYPRLGQRGALHCVACICQEVNNSTKLNKTQHLISYWSIENEFKWQGGKINCTIHECGGQDCASPESSATNECCIHCSSKLLKNSEIQLTLLLCDDDGRAISWTIDEGTPTSNVNYWETSFGVWNLEAIWVEASTNQTQNKQTKS